MFKFLGRVCLLCVALQIFLFRGLHFVLINGSKLKIDTTISFPVHLSKWWRWRNSLKDRCRQAESRMFVICAQLRKQAQEEVKSLRYGLTSQRAQVRAMKQSSFMTAGDLSPRGRPPRSPERPTLPARSWSPSRTSSAAFYNLQSTLPAVVEFLLTSVRSHFKLCGYKGGHIKYKVYGKSGLWESWLSASRRGDQRVSTGRIRCNMRPVESSKFGILNKFWGTLRWKGRICRPTTVVSALNHSFFEDWNA